MEVVTFFTWLDRGEEHFDAATGSEIRYGSGLCLFEQGQSRIEWAAGASSFCERFDRECTSTAIPVGSKVDIESVKIDIAALWTMEVLRSYRIQVAWEDRFKVAIGSCSEVDEVAIELHQRGRIRIAGASQTEHQADAGHRGSGHIFAVIVIPLVVS